MLLPLILLVVTLGSAWWLAGLLESSVEKWYHSYPRKPVDLPDALHSGTLNCPYCKNSIIIDDPIVCCDDCGTVFHYECWNATESCAVFGCKSQSARPV